MPEVPAGQAASPGGSVPRPLRIAVDAMGGDSAPAVEVEGAIGAAREAQGALEVVLVGMRQPVEEELARQGGGDLPISVVNADEVIEMAESPMNAVRRKRASSVAVAAELHKTGDVNGLVSAGNTGAVVASTLLRLGKLPRVRRPAIAAVFPTTTAPAVVLDVGASIDSRPHDLLDFAVMGETFARYMMGRADPRVALLNIGEESGKGSELTQQAYDLLSGSILNFIGNVEGRSLLRGAADVVICDGFVGNVMLKLTEGVIDILYSAIGKGSGAGGIEGLARQLDYSEYGGAPLLGVNGVVIIAHGSSSAKAIKNAVGVAARFVDSDLDGRIVERLREVEAAGNG